MLIPLLLPDGSTDRLTPASLGLFGLAVTVTAAWSSALTDLLYRPALPPYLLLPMVAAKTLTALATFTFWAAWLSATLALLHRDTPRPATLAGRILLTQAPFILAAGLLTPFAILFPHETWIRTFVLGLLGLWSIGLQADVIRRTTGWNAARAWLFLLANLALSALLAATALTGTLLDLNFGVFGRS